MGLFNKETQKLMSKVIKTPPTVLARYSDSKMWKKKFPGNIESIFRRKPRSYNWNLKDSPSSMPYDKQASILIMMEA